MKSDVEIKTGKLIDWLQTMKLLTVEAKIGFTSAIFLLDQEATTLESNCLKFAFQHKLTLPL